MNVDIRHRHMLFGLHAEPRRKTNETEREHHAARHRAHGEAHGRNGCKGRIPPDRLEPDPGKGPPLDGSWRCRGPRSGRSDRSCRLHHPHAGGLSGDLRRSAFRRGNRGPDRPDGPADGNNRTRTELLFEPAGRRPRRRLSRSPGAGQHPGGSIRQTARDGRRHGRAV